MGLIDKETFQEELATSMKAYREGDLLALNGSALMRTNLITDLLFLDETPLLATQHELLGALLHWGMTQIKPAGKPDWLANQWRHYHVLNGFYIENQRVADLAERMAIAEQTFYEWRNTALAMLGQIIYQEYLAANDLFGRQHHFLQLRVLKLAEGETAVLTLVTLADQDLLWRRFFSPREQALLPKLSKLYLLRYDPAMETVSQPELLKRHLRLLIPADYQEESHAILYQRFQRGGMIRAAVYHAQQAGLTAEAVQLAIAQSDALFQSNDGGGLSQLLGGIAAHNQDNGNIDANHWAQFMSVAAKAAEWEDNLALALQYSRQALSATDLTIKLNHYHQRAKLLSRVNLDECLSHYAVGIDLFERLAATQPESVQTSLLSITTRMHIDRAWIFIQDRPDYPQAEHDLAAAQTLIPPANSHLWADLYNAQAELLARTESAAAALPFHLKALAAAEESQDIERMSKMSYMVGLDYMFTEAYHQAKHYFQSSLTHAEQSNNMQMVATAHKGLGGCDFFLQAYNEAIHHYLKAYELWHEKQNRNWLTNICYDLAEGYATIYQFEEAQRYYEEGIALAKALDLHRFYEEFLALKEQFPSLELTLDNRQTQTLAFVDEHGRINRQQYMELTGVAKSQAYRDLNDLCEQGLLTRAGVGRGTHYIRA